MTDSRAATSMVALMAWTIRQKRADIHAAGRGDAASAAADLAASLSRLQPTAVAASVAQLGTRVDTSATPLVVRLDPDAEFVYLTAEEILSKAALGLVVSHALRGSWPGWGQGLARYTAAAELVWSKREAGHSLVEGQLVWQQAGENHWPRIRQAGGRSGRSAPYCQVIWHDRAEHLDALRAAYHQWHAALWSVWQGIESRPSRLRRWRIEGIGAPRNPWLREQREEKP